MPIRVTKVDYIVAFVIAGVFLYAFFFLSWIPILDAEGEKIINPNTGLSLPQVNLFVVIGPIILLYEIFLFTCLDGKPKLKEINKKYYIYLFVKAFKDKIQEGKYLTKEYLNRKK